METIHRFSSRQAKNIIHAGQNGRNSRQKSCVSAFVGFFNAGFSAEWPHPFAGAQPAAGQRWGLGAIVMLGLLIAFTFANAYSRFEKRRDLIVSEYNAIGTAYLRLQLLPIDRQPALRDKFHEYVKSRYQLWLLLLPDVPSPG